VQRNAPLSIIVRDDRNVTRYERGGMELHSCRQRSRMICYWRFRFGVETFEMERV